MGIQKKAAVIDGVRYEVSSLDAYTAIPVWHKVAKVILPVVNSLSSSASALQAMLATPDVTQAALIGKLVTQAGAIAIKEMDPADLRFCIDKFAEVTTVDLGGGKSPQLGRVFADHFASNLVSMAKWFHLCMEVNYGDFLGVARAMMASARSNKPSAEGAKAEDTAQSSSPAAPTG